MKFDYAPIKAVADSLISQFGNPATIDYQRITITAAMDILGPLIVGRGTQFLGRA